MGFNNFVEKYYGGDYQVSRFGLDSSGHPTSKRMLGTMGNPNDNAILFLFFLIYFFNEDSNNIKNKILFYLATLALFFCQSRTGFTAFVVIYVMGVFLYKLSLKSIITDTLIFIAMYSLQLLMGNLYINSLAGNIAENTSLNARFEVWKMLFQMIKQKPFFGYAPNKEFFDANKIYADNQYVLIAWRYGFVGFLLFMLWIGYGFLMSIKNKIHPHAKHLLLFLTVIIITSITNAPLNNAKIIVMLAIYTGMYFNGKHIAQKEMQ